MTSSSRQRGGEALRLGQEADGGCGAGQRPQRPPSLRGFLQSGRVHAQGTSPSKLQRPRSSPPPFRKDVVYPNCRANCCDPASELAELPYREQPCVMGPLRRAKGVPGT